jgi:hypothetical protein
MMLSKRATFFQRHRLAMSLFGIVAASSIIIPACGGHDPIKDLIGSKTDKPTTLSVTQNPSPLRGGQVGTIVAVVRDEQGNPVAADISFEIPPTPDDAFATITPTGVLTAKVVQGLPSRELKVKVYALTALGYKDPADISVTVTILSRITALTPTSGTASVRVGESANLAATPVIATGSPATPAPLIYWESADPTKVSVDPTGRITGVSPTAGTTTVAVTPISEGVRGTTPVLVTVQAALVPTVVVSPSSVSLNVGNTTTLAANVINAPAGTTVTWAPLVAANNQYVSVSPTGVVTAKAPTPLSPTTGQPTSVPVTASITVNGVTYSGASNVTVVARTPTTISLVRLVGGVPQATTNETLAVGEAFTIAALIRDQNGTLISDATAVWTSSNTAVVTVTQEGIVTAVAPGNASIVARPTTNPLISAQTTITVFASGPKPTIAVTAIQPNSTTPTPVSATTPIGLGVANGSQIAVTVANPVAGGALSISVRDPSLASYSPSSNNGTSSFGSLVGKGTGSTFLDVSYTANGTTVTQAIPINVGSTTAGSRVARVILEPQNSVVTAPVGFSFRPRFYDVFGVQLTDAEVAADGGTVSFFNSNNSVGTVVKSTTLPTTAQFTPGTAGTENVTVLYSKNGANVATDNTDVTVNPSTPGNVGSLTFSTANNVRIVRVGAANALTFQVIVRDQGNVIVTTGTAPTVSISATPGAANDPTIATITLTGGQSGFFYTIEGLKPGSYTLTAKSVGAATSIPIVIIP